MARSWTNSETGCCPSQSTTRGGGSVAAELVSEFADRGDRVAVITHGMFKPILVSALLGRPFVGNEWLGDLYNTSATQLELSSAGVTLESYNDTWHLTPETTPELLTG